ncbi:MAG: putative IclR family transcriptional regulator [Microbacteriaceae bacterium]|jgi:DNA-binding IclR family transcriptional regulator|nr:putative IclR family transcriptional regulator [Microbacteriaceae bacterium]
MTTDETLVKPSSADGVLARAFHVMNMVGASGHSLTLAELSRVTGLPKTTAHRVLQQLIRLGALERDGDLYRIGLQMFVLSSAVPEMSLRAAALKRMLELQNYTGHTLHLATMRDDRVVYLEKIGNKRSDDIPTVVGGSFAAHATGVGKAMLAYLPRTRLQGILSQPLEKLTSRTISDPAALLVSLRRVRELGIAFDDEEAAPKLRCVAHPVMYMGSAVAGVSISYPSNAALDKAAVAALRATCTSIGNDLARLHLPWAG